eukprot:SAG11_NODE_31070_length_295_cov_0.790816_1_plen_57_part_01
MRLYRARSGDDKPIREGSCSHGAPVRLIGYNAVFDTAISMDDRGMVEYWDPETFDFP